MAWSALGPLRTLTLSDFKLTKRGTGSFVPPVVAAAACLTPSSAAEGKAPLRRSQTARPEAIKPRCRTALTCPMLPDSADSEMDQKSERIVAPKAT
jgi:hypothetical protein